MSGEKDLSGRKMDRKIEEDLTRRGVLRSIGVAGAAAASGIVSQAGAFEIVQSSSNTSDVEVVLESEQLGALQDELGSFDIKPETIRHTEVRPATSDGDDRKILIDIYQLESNLGTVVHVEAPGDDAATILKFDIHAQEKLPRSYRDVPAGTSPGLVATGDDVIFVRDTTEREHRKLAKRADVDPEASGSMVDSSTGGYTITTPFEENRTENYVCGIQHTLTFNSTDSYDLIGSRDLSVGGSLTDGIEIECGGGGGGGGSGCDCGEIIAHIVFCIQTVSSCSLCAKLIGVPWAGPAAVVACVIATGCIGLHDLWLGCTQLVSDYDCVYNCATSV